MKVNVVGTLVRSSMTLALATGLTACVTHTANTSKITAADYKAAAALFNNKTKNLVKNATVEPHWLGNSGRFWYRRDGDQGQEYVVVEGRDGTKIPAFDHLALASALSNALGMKVTAGDMGLSYVTIGDDLKTLTAVKDSKYVSCNLAAIGCQAFDIPAQRTDQLLSPAKTFALTARDHNLVLTTIKTGKERQLTTDGKPYYSYGKLPDAALQAIPIKKAGLKLPPFGAEFSPDERYLIAARMDERHVSTHSFLESVPTDGSLKPIVHKVRSGFVGDRNVMKIDGFIFDIKTGTAIPIQKPAGINYSLSTGKIIGWSAKHNQVFMLYYSIGSKKAGIFRVDLKTGKSKIVIKEVSDTRVQLNTALYHRPNVRVLGDGDEIVWFSERTGWGHLYLYDAQTGALKNSITRGNWLVQDIHQLDVGKREVYFTGGGRERGRDPYFRHLYKASLDGGPVTLLTDKDADHHFTPEPSMEAGAAAAVAQLIRPDLGIFIDTYSTVSQPPVTVLRSTKDGRIITTLEVADASALFAAGWKAPVRKAVKAADGVTDIYAVYYAPKKALAGARHPVIDAVYGGPQMAVAPRNFIEAYLNRATGHPSSMTQLGFAVVTIDGRGTPSRSKAFWRAGYPEATQVGIDDHVAAIKQLAEDHPEMDLNRVGVYGWSWGGTFAAQAILSWPDFYHVAVSSAGLYDYSTMYSAFEAYVDLPKFSDGSIYRSNPQEKPANWHALDVTQMAANLQGNLLIVYGEMDENVPPTQAFLLANALINANKPYDLLYLPNSTHADTGKPYVFQRFMDYFVEHLLDTSPPRDIVVE
ncbi:prolyl oligopeptidase family serine peptidase [Exilibacterium tricleocarpae]|uniref:Prolyl oligopeptidase family serine peptidase n=1 Tax=Exilibacterium tricleocarpae TaxID=2591008 RepID=A0A545UBG6_9GAMM|nr:DPP IV N-terminal domain-containing protein [Exilibacterium tricleocarpae]TQV86816.1 prolyl oligopeptidase family serine peptidase [Exilibacterium tricleocarpae]